MARARRPTDAKKPRKSKNVSDLRPGSSPEDASAVGGAGDFGAKADDTTERTYASRHVLRADPGKSHARSDAGGGDSARVSGASGVSGGPGASSGGDLDTDLIGVGTGGTGVAGSPSREHVPGPDDTDGTSNEFAAGGPAKGENQTLVGKIGGNKRIDGTVHQPADDAASGPGGQGADATTSPDANARADAYGDGFAGEISGGEATGGDQAGR
jgi:hypothetical protein